jgi:hypothetical protein
MGWRIVVAAFAIVVGGSLIIVGWLWDPDGYGGAVLLEVGAAILLVVPLVFVERILERRIEETEERTAESVGEVRTELEAVRQEVEDAKMRLDDISAVVPERLRQADESLRTRIAELRASVSFDSVRQMLREAGARRAISKDGVRVGIPGTEDRIRFETGSVRGHDGRDEPRIWVRLESLEGTQKAVHVWNESEDPATAWEALVRASQRAGVYETAIENVGAVFPRLAETLELAVDVRSGPLNPEVGPIREQLAGKWVLTDNGLDYGGDDGEPYGISYSRLKELSQADMHRIKNGDVLSWGWSSEQGDTFGVALWSAWRIVQGRRASGADQGAR